ncbi:hypothetical protein [Thioalkalivibrio thiocyanoxidans]|uniref:hypothetical protein n=1 Tax=Thioalkalivibrio thiocyanoxidans TaxID=152475 RepID=UPI00036A6503|nr:hypothetical protein [Thioalkalivibrio thiocyanoxidans]
MAHARVAIDSVPRIRSLIENGWVLIMIIAAIPETLVGPVLEGFTPFSNQHSCVVFQVSRLVKLKG